MSNTTADHVGKAKMRSRKPHDREIELKRERGEISCAECRRLKLKCNKKVPCSSCLRRGCHPICPNGSLSTGQGTRFVLAKTDKLHSKLNEMSQRIRQLEDALKISHAGHSTDGHPLLSEDHLAIKAGVDLLGTEEDEEENGEDQGADANLGLSLGTLAISDCGDTRYVGISGAEALLLERRIARVPWWAKEDHDDDTDGFPFASTISKDELYPLIAAQLPSYERATALVEAYLENFSWFFRPIERAQIVGELLPTTYGWLRAYREATAPNDAEVVQNVNMHRLALTFAVFACGALADLTLPPDNDEAPPYRQLTKACLVQENLFNTVSLDTVQAISMLAAYDLYLCTRNSLEFAWKMSSFAMVLASSIGLHRDPERWHLDPKIMDRRRSVFWELFHVDKWKSLGSGRPAIYRLEDVDCKFPEDNEQVTMPDGSKLPGYFRWRQNFNKYVIGPLSESFGSVRPMKYSEVLEFDRKIRDSEFVHEKEISDSSDPTRYMWELYKDISLLFLHRNYFARAMIEHSDNPLKSPFAPSFLAAYATSISFLRNLRNVHQTKPDMVMRFWSCWTHALAAAVMLGTVASRNGAMTLAPTAFEELVLAIALFEKATEHFVVRNGLPILLRLRDKALQSRTLAGASVLGKDSAVYPVKMEELSASDELSILRGTARVLQMPSEKARTRRQESVSASTGSSDRSSPAAASSPSGAQSHGSTTHSASSPFTGFNGAGASAQHVDKNFIPSWMHVPAQVQTGADLSSYLGLPFGSTSAQGVLPQSASSGLGFDGPSMPMSSFDPAQTSMTSDDWSELGLRTVLESLAQPAAASSSTGAPGLATQAQAQGGSGVTNFGLQDFGGGGSVNPNQGLGSGQLLPALDDPFNPDALWPPEQYLTSAGAEVCDAMSMSMSSAANPGSSDATMSMSADASLLEAWRAISEFPEFNGLGLDMNIDSIFSAAS